LVDEDTAFQLPLKCQCITENPNKFTQKCDKQKLGYILQTVGKKWDSQQKNRSDKSRSVGTDDKSYVAECY